MVELRVLNGLLHDVLILDVIFSMVWSERHGEAGELELKIPLSFSTSEYIAVDNFISKSDTDVVMVIESILPTFDEEFGDSLVIKGHTSDILLDRRVPLNVVNFNGLVQGTYFKLLDDNVIAPSNSARIIPNITYVSNPAITNTLLEQFDSGTLYDILKSISAATGLGFKMSLVDFTLVFSFYEIANRSAEQYVNPPVIFSKEFDNVKQSTYEYITGKSKNVTLVIVEDEIASLQRTLVYIGSEPSGMGRRETYSIQNISRTVSGEDDLTDADVSGIIVSRGIEQLSGLQPIVVFDGEFETDIQFVYGVDFFLGDIVQCVILGHDVPAQAVEYVHSIEGDGDTKYVSFDFEF